MGEFDDQDGQHYPGVGGRGRHGIGARSDAPLAARFRRSRLRACWVGQRLRVAGEPSAGEGRDGHTAACTILLNGERVDIYQFNTTFDATTAAGQMSADGSQQRTGPFSMAEIDWVAPPHFFRVNRVIAMYIGRSDAALIPLHQVMGAPFAEEKG